MSKALLFTNGYFQPLDNEGNPVPNGTLTVRNSLDGTLSTIYKDSDMSITQSNPASLDGAGKVPIYLPPGLAYDIELKDPTGAVIWTISDYTLPSSAEMLTFDKLADMKNFSIDTSEAVMARILGYSTANDGGEGTFIWDSTSTATADDGVIVASNYTATGRWIRQDYEYVKPEFFGAKGDGVNDDTAALNKAFAYDKVELSNATYSITGYIDGRGDKYIKTNGAIIEVAGIDNSSYALGSNMAALHLGTTSSQAWEMIASNISGSVSGHKLTTSTALNVALEDILGVKSKTVASEFLIGRLVALNTFSSYEYFFDNLPLMSVLPNFDVYKLNSAVVTMEGTLTFSHKRNPVYRDMDYVYSCYINGVRDSKIDIATAPQALYGVFVLAAYNSKINVNLSQFARNKDDDAAGFIIRDSAYCTVTGNVNTWGYGILGGSTDIGSMRLKIHADYSKSYEAATATHSRANALLFQNVHFSEFIGNYQAGVEITGNNNTVKANIYTDTDSVPEAIDFNGDGNLFTGFIDAPNMSTGDVIIKTAGEYNRLEDVTFSTSTGLAKLQLEKTLVNNMIIPSNDLVFEVDDHTVLNNVMTAVLHNPVGSITGNSFKGITSVIRLELTTTIDSSSYEGWYTICASALGTSAIKYKVAIALLQVVDPRFTDVAASSDRFFYDESADCYALVRQYGSTSAGASNTVTAWFLVSY